MKRLLLLCTLILFCCAPVWARTWTFGPHQSHKLNQAFARLETGDKVILERGTYRLRNRLVLDGKKNIRIEGRGRVELIVSDLFEPVFEIRQCENIQVRHLRARHEEPAYGYECEGAVISVQKSNRVGIWDSQLNGCGAAGVYAMSSFDVVVKNNKIFNNSYAGVWLHDSRAYVVGNRITGNAASVVTTGKSWLTMLENKIEDNQGNIYSGAEDLERLFRR